ncbi:MAG: hypothetical protein KGS73_09580 [Chloroflexi bacterium]|nr:hypothetical protein [Chloroflexota bacterium]
MQLWALGVTLLVEGGGMAAATWLLPGWRARRRRSVWLAVWLALALNLVSHTVFWFLLPALPVAPPWKVPVGEGAVVLLEGGVYAACLARPRWSGWGVSLGLNLASWGLASQLWFWLL